MTNEKSFYGNWILESGLCAMATSMYFAVVLPLQSYLSNSDGFTFDFADLIYGCCLRMFCLLLFLWIILFVTRRWCRGWLHLALIGLTLSAIVEAGPGAIGLPELNGDFAGYRSVARGIVDSVVLVVMFVIPLLFRRFLKEHLSLVSICLMLFTVASLFDVKKSEASGDAPPDNSCVKEFVSRKEVLQCAKFSPESNVILLILDATASFAVQDILKTDVRLASDFEGFVNYTQNVGMHNPTQVGVPGLLTGKYFQSARDIVQYGRSFISNDSVICPYVKKNVPVYFNVANMAFSEKGYTNRRIGGSELVKPVGLEVFDEQMPGTFTLTVDDLCVFRILPYFFKERFLMSQKIADMHSCPAEKGTISKRINLNDVDSDGQVWPFLAGSLVDKNCRQTFHVHHTKGGHVPIVCDENGKAIRCPHPQYVDYCGQCKFALRKVAEMFNVWKTNGVYDASTIVIVGDHGPWFVRPGMDPAKIPPPAFPVLMLKPRASREAYAESDLPTTHANVSKVLKALAFRPMNRVEMEQILATDEPRLFRLASSGKLKDWYVLKDGSVKFMNREDREPSLEELKSLEYEVDYGFRSSGSTIYPDFRVESGNRVDSGGLAIAGSEMIVYIKIPEPCMITLYGVTWGRQEKGGVVDLEVGGVHREFKAEFNKYVSTTCQFECVKSDNNGIVKMKFKKPGDSLHFVLTNIKLSPSRTVK